MNTFRSIRKQKMMRIYNRFSNIFRIDPDFLDFLIYLELILIFAFFSAKDFFHRISSPSVFLREQLDMLCCESPSNGG